VDEVWEVLLDYPIRPRARYGYGSPPHRRLHAILDRSRNQYAETLKTIIGYRDHLLRIAVDPPQEAHAPYWLSGWLPGLDLACLYGMVAQLNPRTYLEVGSGSSTQFVRRAVDDQGLRTRIISIDPSPRSEIDALCDEVVREPLEEANLEIFDQLVAGDIVFVDNSHRCFQNSDVTVMFLDVLPRLNPGAYVEFHDICLPDDYPPDYIDRFYSEQYVLAAALLAEGTRFEVVLANWFISADPELSSIVEPLWAGPRMDSVPRHGSSFWIRMAGPA
jgi:hypothetical protein